MADSIHRSGADRTSFEVRVPASTSNLGSGFDTVSAALNLYLTLQVLTEGTREWQWLTQEDQPLPLPEEKNLVSRAMRDTLAFLGGEIPGIRIRMNNPIPLTRGLGSSAAAIVAGIKIVEHVLERRLSTDQIFRIAYPLEGHPDNLSASLLGGWVLSRVDGEEMRAVRLSASLSCRFVAAVPEVPVSTREAREILPAEYPREDVTYNLQRCALLVHALAAGKRELLREATSDRLHQPFRSRLVPGLEDLLDLKGLPAPLSENVLGVTISGSGSTVIALADGNYEAIGEWMEQTLAARGTPASWQVLDLDTHGAQVSPAPEA